jgi:hypothetical protein
VKFDDVPETAVLSGLKVAAWALVATAAVASSATTASRPTFEDVFMIYQPFP